MNTNASHDLAGLSFMRPLPIKALVVSDNVLDARPTTGNVSFVETTDEVWLKEAGRNERFVRVS